MAALSNRWRCAVALLTVLIAGGPALADVAAPSVPPARAAGEPAVVLLHGLARSAGSMKKMATALEGAGYRVCNIDYPSTEHAIASLASDHVLPAMRDCGLPEAPVNFVTHSMGGIMVRHLAELPDAPDVGRVVMLGPPNAGSEVVDRIGGWPVFGWINGPAGRELGTDADSAPNRLGPVDFPLGVIAGRHSINWINSLMIPGPDDGKVSVARARVEGMTDFIVLPVTHPLMMRDRTVIALLSDHGEEFKDHGRIGHGIAMFTETLRIPFVLSLPGDDGDD